MLMFPPSLLYTDSRFSICAYVCFVVSEAVDDLPFSGLSSTKSP